jgi:Cu+-exporting ATPase
MSKSLEEKENIKLVFAVVLAMPLILQMLSDIFGGAGFISLGILIVSATLLQLTISSYYIELLVGLRQGKVTVEGLTALATLSLFTASIILWVNNGVTSGAAFAAVNAIVIPISLLARNISGKIVSPLPKARDDEFMMPRDASLKQSNGFFEKVPISQIRQGDLIQVLGGEICPVDGAIISGTAMFTSVEINADPMPRFSTKGDNIFAGAECFGEGVVVRAIKGGYDSKLTDACSYARMVSRFDQTSRLVDKYLTPLALTALIGSFLIGLMWLGLEGGQQGAIVGLATLGLSITAGFGLISSLPQFFGVEYLKTRGVLIHKADIVETARKINHVYVSPIDMFLMRSPRLGSFHTEQSEEEMLSIVYGMLKSIKHPLLQPIQLACEFRSIRPASLRKVFFDAARGISGEYEGRLMLFGNPALLSTYGVGYHKFGKQVSEMEALGEMVFWLAEAKPDKECLAIFSFHPTVRSTANDAVERIIEDGINVDMLSQFSKDRHFKYLKDIKFSSILPVTNSIQIYNNVIQAQAVDDVVAVCAMSPMDLPAAQAADITIMSATGPSMLMSYATITLSSSDPTRLASALIVTKAMGNKISSNLKIALGFTALVLVLGTFNFLTPVIGNLLALASVGVIGFNSYMVKSVK